MTDVDITKNVPTCHLKIYIFTWIVKCLMVRENSHQHWHCAEKPIRYTEAQKHEEKQEEERLRAAVKKELGINLGDPTSMPEGNKFKKCSDDLS